MSYVGSGATCRATPACTHSNCPTMPTYALLPSHPQGYHNTVAPNRKPPNGIHYYVNIMSTQQPLLVPWHGMALLPPAHGTPPRPPDREPSSRLHATQPASVGNATLLNTARHCAGSRFTFLFHGSSHHVALPPRHLHSIPKLPSLKLPPRGLSQPPFQSVTKASTLPP